MGRRRAKFYIAGHAAAFGSVERMPDSACGSVANECNHASDRGNAHVDQTPAWARRLCQLTGYKEHRFLDTLAVAYAETGQFEQAAEAARQAIDVIQNAPQNDAHQPARQEIQARLQLFQKRQPYRETSWLNAP